MLHSLPSPLAMGGINDSETIATTRWMSIAQGRPMQRTLRMLIMTAATTCAGKLPPDERR
ncbi:MAG: hypothetical protein ACREH8_02560 [Opitutaceae bacterium]